MVFTTTNLFKSIACPVGVKCSLTNCVFSHEMRSEIVGNVRDRSTQEQQLRVEADDNHEREHAAKRIKLDTSDYIQMTRVLTETVKAAHESDIKLSSRTVGTEQSYAEAHERAVLPSLSRPVSPPARTTNGRTYPSTPLRMGDISSKDKRPKSNTSSHETLNPRLIPCDPVGHAKRSIYLKHMYKAMCQLNTRSGDPGRSETSGMAKIKILNEYEIIRFALDEEEKVARDQPTVYTNVVKKRIAQFQKMSQEEWELRTAEILEPTKNSALVAEGGRQRVETGLSPENEISILSLLVERDQNSLQQYGYVAVPPSVEEAAEAAAAVSASHNYEQCDRCGSRFQVFPDRNELGKLTSGGPCTYHPNRLVYRPSSKSDNYTGHKEPHYQCCNSERGSVGCTSVINHVFKASNAARLAAVLPFMETPDNEHPRSNSQGQRFRAIAFDCEMGYTVYGLELIRLTAISWPEGEALIDVLVRPLGTIIDLNTRFSGIRAEHFAHAVPFQEWPKDALPVSSSSSETTRRDEVMDVPSLPLVSSPGEARALLCTFLTPQTLLLGHAIDNDLNAVRLCHPAIVDTVRLYPHRKGLPQRMGLKALSAHHLGWSIQTGGARGHDSLEDAQATGELMRAKVRDKWRAMQARGWRLKDGAIVAPAGEDVALATEPSRPAKGTMLSRERVESSAAEKRCAEGRVGGPRDEVDDSVAACLQRARESGSNRQN